MHRLNERSLFTRFSSATSHLDGRPVSFFIAVAIIAIWAITGPLFRFSDTWQLIINTGTTIVTFLMVFLIQSTQNRDAQAIQIKLDELIRSMKGAHLALLDLEELEDADLKRICTDYRELAKRAREDLDKGKSDTDVREVGHEYNRQISESRRQTTTTHKPRDTANRSETRAAKAHRAARPKS